MSHPFRKFKLPNWLGQIVPFPIQLLIMDTLLKYFIEHFIMAESKHGRKRSCCLLGRAKTTFVKVKVVPPSNDV